MPESSAPCELLEWDTEFFGFRIARVAGDSLTAERVAAIDAWCRQQRVDCLYFLSRSNDPGTTRLAEENRFRLVDIRITLRHLGEHHGSVAAESVRAASPKDVPILQAIAGDSYQDSRFYFDSSFPKHLSKALYETWIQRSCEGYADAVLVAEAGGDLTGYVTCHVDHISGQGKIGLLGVSSRARGQGVGLTLVSAALDWFRSRRIAPVSVVTQGRNHDAQRLYQRCGFLTHSVELWYHKWYRTPGLAGG